MLGIIYGSPTTVGTYQVTVSASDAQHTTTAPLTITIFDPPSSGPVIQSGASVTGRTGGSFVFGVISTEDGNINASGLPPGLSIDPTTGRISGTPTSDNSSLVTLTAGTHMTTLQLTFFSNTTVPVINSSDNVSVVPNQPFCASTITADTVVTPTFSLIQETPGSLYSLPPNLTFDPQTATISGMYVGTPIMPPPDTIKIRPPLVAIVQTDAHNANGTGTRPLNFFQVVAGSRKSDGQGGILDIPLPLFPATPGIDMPRWRPQWRLPSRVRLSRRSRSYPYRLRHSWARRLQPISWARNEQSGWERSDVDTSPMSATRSA